MKLNTLATGIVAGCAAVLISTIPGFAGQTPKAPPQTAAAKAKSPVDMSAKCKAMMADHEKMMADMKAADERLDALVATMNAAPVTEKADATAAVVSEMVAQRRAMRDGMMKMQHEMMAHMTEHMQAGKDSMAMCPMMKPMGAMKH